MKKIAVFLVDDHAIVRDGLKLLINGQSDMHVVGEAEHGRNLAQLVQESGAELVVMGFRIPLRAPDEPRDDLDARSGKRFPERRGQAAVCDRRDAGHHGREADGAGTGVARGRAHGRTAQVERDDSHSVDASAVAIIIVDRAEHVQTWNAAAEQMFGWSADEVIGRTMPNIPADQSAALVLAVAQVFEGVAPLPFDMVQRRRDETDLDVNLSLAPLRDADGTIRSYIAIMQDISDRKRLERERESRCAASSTLRKKSRAVSPASFTTRWGST